MTTPKQIRQRAIEDSQNWWYCDNLLNHPGQCGLLRMSFPRVFILIRDEETAYWADYENWKNNVVEVNFFTPSERSEADLDSILTEAWNFLALYEEEEERQYELNNGYEDEDF
jgi:hypothetical protein